MKQAVIDMRHQQGDLRLDAEVVVVGSGAAGAVIATELAQAGVDVVILEEGKYLAPETYGRMRPSEAMRHLWRDGGMTMAAGLGDSPSINLTMGRAIGGSSLATGGVCFRTPEHVLQRWVEEHGLGELSPKQMEPFFERVEQSLKVSRVPDSQRSRSTTLFGEGLQQAHGARLDPVYRNMSGCKGRSRCNFGCPEGAKLSTDISYLPRAVRDGARIYAGCLVERVLTRGQRAAGVEGRLLNGRHGRPAGRLQVHARYVVMAAGAVHTPLVLMRSRIGRRSRMVGKNLTLHPSMRIFARFDQEVRGWEGALQSAYSDAFKDEGITLMSVFVPPGVFGAAMPGVGPEHHARAAHVPHLAMFGALVHDEGGGRIRRTPGREPIVTYRMHPEDRSRLPRAMRLLGEAYFAAGAKELFFPILGLQPVDADAFRKLDLERIHGRRIECASQHPLGSCRMGSAPDHSVVDPDGQSWELSHLYVADSSIIPSSLGVNPQVTVMAMATRIAWKLAERIRPIRRSLRTVAETPADVGMAAVANQNVMN